MALYRYQKFSPIIGNECFIAPSADVIGRVTLGNLASIWFGVIVRGDVNEIIIGNKSNVQDISMLHVTEKNGLYIGDEVTIAHSVTLHGCKIANNCLIGMGATVLDGAEISERSVVAAGSVVTPGKKFPPRSLIKGFPAKLERELSDEELLKYSENFNNYIMYRGQFLDPKQFSLIS
jgi:carbonic anhydrase/acetyltransferase-like protein (isoleucine patch superfamily)